MKYITVILRFIIAYIWFHLMSLWDFNINSVEFYYGLWFILISIYFLILSSVNSNKLTCPIIDIYKNN